MMQQDICKIFIGYDPREAVTYHVLCHSILSRSSVPVQITPLTLESTGIKRQGSNAFTYSRFLVPELCGFDGWALYLDSDMLCLCDIKELFDLKDNSRSVGVVKHSYTSKHQQKYIGTPMTAPNDNYPRKNWSSLMLWNCGSYKNHVLTKEYVETASPQDLHRFGHLGDDRIFELPKEYNHLVGEQEKPEVTPKIIHWTLGSPCFSYYKNDSYSDLWFKEFENCAYPMIRNDTGRF